MMRQLAANNLVLVLQYGVSGLVPLVLVPHVVREIGLAQFGTLSIALAWATYGAVIVQYAFQLSGPRQLAHLAPGESAYDVLCRIGSAKLVLLGMVILCLAAGTLVAGALGHPVGASQSWLLVALPLAAALHTGWHLQTSGRFATVSGLSIAGALLSLAVGLIAVSDARAVAAAAVALSIGPLWTGATTFAASLRLLSAAPDSAEQRTFWRSPGAELRAGWPLFASQFTSALYTASGPIVVGLLAGIEQAGAYSAVERISNPVIAMCLLTHTAAYPKLAQLYSTDRRAYMALLRIVLLAYLGVASGLVLAAIIAWRPLLSFVLGASGSEHSALLAVALVWILLGVFGSALTGYLTVSGEGKAVLPLTMKILGASLLFGIPGVYFWGAWAWMASLCIAQVFVLALGWRAWNTEADAVSTTR